MKRAGKIGPALYIVLCVALFSCTPDDPQSTFDTLGPVARSQLVLFYWILGGAVLVFAAVGAALIYAQIKFKRKPGDGDPVQTHGHTLLEIGWIVLPVLVLAVVAVPTVITIFYNANSPDPDALTINVTGHQWWWEFEYPHPTDNDSYVSVSNELHIPAGEVVNINLESKDVLHSFWIPKLAGKVDMVPNQKNSLWIQSDSTGEFLGQCAEFCGAAHAWMRFRVIASPKAEFEKWLLSQSRPGDVPSDGSLAQEGKAIFEGKQAECWVCHSIKGSDRSRGQTGPDLTHLASRNHIGAGLLENTPENIKSWLTRSDEVKPGNLMYKNARVFSDPERKLSTEQVSALIAYLTSLR